MAIGLAFLALGAGLGPGQGSGFAAVGPDGSLSLLENELRAAEGAGAEQLVAAEPNPAEANPAAEPNPAEDPDLGAAKLEEIAEELAKGKKLLLPENSAEETKRYKRLLLVGATLVPFLALTLVALANYGSGPLGLLWALVLGLNGLVASAILASGQSGWARRPELQFWAINFGIQLAGVLCGALAILFDRKVDAALGVSGAMLFRTAGGGALAVGAGAVICLLHGLEAQVIGALVLAFFCNSSVYVVLQFSAVMEPRAQGIVSFSLTVAPLLALAGLQMVPFDRQLTAAERGVLFGPSSVMTLAASLALLIVWPRRQQDGGGGNAEIDEALERLQQPEGEDLDEAYGLAWPPAPYPWASLLGFVNGGLTFVVVPLFIGASEPHLVTRLISERFYGEMLGTALGSLLAFQLKDDGPPQGPLMAVGLLTACRLAVFGELMPMPQPGFVLAFMLVGAVQQAFGAAAIAKAAADNNRRRVAQSDALVRLLGSLAGLGCSAKLLGVV